MEKAAGDAAGISDTVKIRVYVSTNKVGSECTDELEFDRAEWDAMSNDEREEVCRDAAFNFLDWGWEEV